MSKSKQETIADIVAEMRRIKYNGEDCTVKWCLTFWADRIEAAYNFEREAVCENSSHVGNAAAMRKALNEIQLVCYKAGITIGYDVACGIIKSKSRAARSDPPRNCDVGTVDEQLKRFSAFCMSRKCNECPFVSSTYGECGVRWSQMPYEGGAE